MFHRGLGSNADIAGTPCGEMCEAAQGRGPAPLIAAINELQSQISSCPSSINQATAAHALVSDRSFVRDGVRLDKERRDCGRARPNAILDGRDQAGLRAHRARAERCTEREGCSWDIRCQIAADLRPESVDSVLACSLGSVLMNQPLRVGAPAILIRQMQRNECSSARPNQFVVSADCCRGFSRNIVLFFRCSRQKIARARAKQRVDITWCVIL
jgi:hypothetical protein